MADSRGDEKTGTSGDEATRDGSKASTSDSLDGVQSRQLPVRPQVIQNSGETIISTPAIPSGSVPSGVRVDRPQNPDETIVGPSRLTAAGGATVTSGGAALRTPRPEGAKSPAGPVAFLQIGTILGSRYEILDILGEGGMGTVYKAADREVNRIVALKVIRPEMTLNPEILARFKQELLLSSKVTHRNVIRIYDLGEGQGVKFITMEFLEGENLHNIVRKRGRLEIAEAVGMMEQVSSGLAAAHREGIIHRDLKPANIMIEKNGRVVVMDFGLARTFSGDGMTQTGAMLGTIEYMSPEQAQGLDVKASSDVFTVGLILYELLAGVAPFHAESAIASLLKRTQQRAVPLADVDKNIPGSLSNIVARCLEKDPANRYQSAEELVVDLRAWQGGSKNVSASMQLLMNRVREIPWQRFAITGVAAVVLAAGITWYIVGKQRAAKPGAHAPVSVLVGDFTNHTGDPVLDDTLEPMLGVALEGASFINAYSRGDARKLAGKLPNPSNKLDEQSARLVAVSQGVNVVITGDISLRGSEYDISAIALDSVSGSVLAKADVTVSNKEEIVSDLPKLAAPLRKGLGDATPASLQFEEYSGGFTAASIEAVHQNALGVEEQFAGKFQEAFDSFQKATQLDPKFARAYTGMAAMAQNLGRPGDAVRYMKLAMEHEDRMTERERYRDRALYYRTTGDWQNCVQEYSRLIASFPSDRVSQNNLSICYTQLHNAPKALEAARAAVALAPKGIPPRLNLAFISVFAGDFTGGEKEARTALSINPKAGDAYLTIAEAQVGQGQLDKAAVSYHQLGSFGPVRQSIASAGLADLAAYQGKYADAVRLLHEGVAADELSKDTDSAARKLVAAGTIEEWQGKHAAAVADTDKALKSSQTTAIEFLAARNYLETGETAKAQKLAATLSAALTTESQAYGKIITGLIALRRKDAHEAIHQIQAANGLLDTWIGHFDLGRAYLEAEAYTQADTEFDECMNRLGEAMEIFNDNSPTYEYVPFVYYYEGRARQGLNSGGYADIYKTYLSIRGQSSEDPLVIDIRHRLGQ